MNDGLQAKKKASSPATETNRQVYQPVQAEIQQTQKHMSYWSRMGLYMLGGDWPEEECEN